MWEPQRLTTLWASTACYRELQGVTGSGREDGNIITQHANSSGNDSDLCPGGLNGSDLGQDTVYVE
jgi:hypothetical protein